MPATPARTPAGLLAAALERDPARPLLTGYDDGTGERTELSVATFANWVAKTANLLRDELGVQAGASLALRLPLHWQAAVWLQAAWVAGLVVDLGPAGPASTPGDAVDVAVVSHDEDADAPPRAGLVAHEVVSLGLNPMGLAVPGRVPADPLALDYDRSVHSHGDRFAPVVAPAPQDPAVRVGVRAVTGAALVAAAGAAPVTPGGSVLEPGARLLVTTPYVDLRTVVGGLLVPLAGDVTAVLCRRLDPALLADRVRQESIAAALTAVGAAPGLAVVEPALGDMT